MGGQGKTGVQVVQMMRSGPPPDQPKGGCALQKTLEVGKN